MVGITTIYRLVMVTSPTDKKSGDGMLIAPIYRWVMVTSPTAKKRGDGMLITPIYRWVMVTSAADKIRYCVTPSVLLKLMNNN